MGLIRRMRDTVSGLLASAEDPRATPLPSYREQTALLERIGRASTDFAASRKLDFPH
ncbi:MAG: hypothetical protein ACR2PL_19055 [Dehalococcoidia bacterium]